jgi:SAM-dependent methyltransferase
MNKAKAKSNEQMKGEKIMYSEFADRSSWRGGTILRRIVDRRMIRTLVRFNSEFGIGRDFLEIGTGTGNFAKELIDSGHFNYRGVEPNQNLANISKSKTSWDCITVESLPNVSSQINGWADICASFQVLEHASDGYEASTWVSDMARCLKPNGLLVVVSPDIRSFKLDFWNIDWSHCFPTTPANVSQLFVDNGLEVITASTIRAGSSGYLRSLLSQLITLLMPTRLIDSFGYCSVGRAIGTGLKVGYLYANTFVIGRKSSGIQ